MVVLKVKIMNFLCKIFGMICWFLLLTGGVYYIGQFKNDNLALKYLNIELLNYLIFATQLLMAGIVYDCLKVMNKGNLNWNQVALHFKDASIWFLVSLAALFAGLSVKKLTWIFLFLFLYALYKTSYALTEASKLTKNGLKETK
jgi:hypothetical protein